MVTRLPDQAGSEIGSLFDSARAAQDLVKKWWQNGQPNQLGVRMFLARSRRSTSVLKEERGNEVWILSHRTKSVAIDAKDVADGAGRKIAKIAGVVGPFDDDFVPTVARANVFARGFADGYIRGDGREEIRNDANGPASLVRLRVATKGGHLRRRRGFISLTERARRRPGGKCEARGGAGQTLGSGQDPAAVGRSLVPGRFIRDRRLESQRHSYGSSSSAGLSIR